MNTLNNHYQSARYNKAADKSKNNCKCGVLIEFNSNLLDYKVK